MTTQQMDDVYGQRLADSVFAVEANSFEQLCLWKEYHDTYKWEEILDGTGVTVGKLDGRPVFVSLLWARINGSLVLFYDAVSEVVDFDMVEKWLKEHCNPDIGFTDAQNFFDCIYRTLQLAEQDAGQA